mgnify:CR=1 FL=1
MISKRGKRGECTGPGPMGGGRGANREGRPITPAEAHKLQAPNSLRYEDGLSGSAKGDKK